MFQWPGTLERAISLVDLHILLSLSRAASAVPLPTSFCRGRECGTLFAGMTSMEASQAESSWTRIAEMTSRVAGLGFL